MATHPFFSPAAGDREEEEGGRGRANSKTDITKKTIMKKKLFVIHKRYTGGWEVE